MIYGGDPTMGAAKNKFTMVFSGVALCVLILDARTAVHAASEGINLCLTTIVPSLFPFFIITALLTGAFASYRISILAPLGRLLRLPENGELILLIGLLGGYPIGAQCVRQAYCNGQLSTKNAERMLTFCSNAGPAFIFGIGASILPEAWMCWLVWLIQVLSSIIVGWLTPAHPGAEIAAPQGASVTISDAIQRSIRVMATVCSWIVLFKIILTFLSRWILWILPEYVSITLSGLLELSNGCTSLAQIQSIPMRFCLFTVLLSGGGLCVAMQTQTVLMKSGLSLRPYITGKIVQCSVSSILCAFTLLFVFKIRLPSAAILVSAASALICVVYGIGERKSKKRIDFWNRLMYNNGKSSGGNTYETVP
jgi:sporulation integral membrane protein YlbJ